MMENMNKGVVYTCITGGYDHLLKHQWIDSHWDYVCFTDQPKMLEAETLNGWKIQPLFFDELNSHYNSRWHKFFPNYLFPDYETSLWIDGNIDVLTSDVFQNIEKTDKKMLLPVHPWRDCAYAECVEVFGEEKQKKDIRSLQQEFYRAEGFPAHYGLSENNLIFRRHHDKTISRIMEQWWLMLMRFTHRDQIALPFILWKNGFSPADFTMPNTRNPLNFTVEKHNRTRKLDFDNIESNPQDLLDFTAKKHNETKTPFFGKKDTSNHHRRFYLFGWRVLSYKYNVSSYIAKRNLPSINFVTSTDETFGSTRLRVYRIAEGLKRRGFEVTINKNDNADIQVFQKSAPGFLKDRFIRAKRAGKFICFDIDDYHQSCYNFLLCYADMVIVCSEFLKRQYESLNRNIVVLDNMIDISEPVRDFPQYNLHSPKIGWFGNTTNLPALQATGVKDVTTITQGGAIEWRFETIDRELQKFDLILIPQEKTIVGRSKGNCRMLKSLYLGVPALVSDLEPYVQLAKKLGYPSDFIVSDGEDWNQLVEEIKSGKRPFSFDFQKCHTDIERLYGSEYCENLWISNVLFRYWHRKKIGLWSRMKFFLKTFRFLYKQKIGNRRQVTFFETLSFYYTKKEKR